MSEQATVVVGVDGSVKDDRAIAWGAREAVDRGARLRVMYAFKFTGAAYGYGLPAINVAELGESVTEPAAEGARSLFPDLEVTTATKGEDPGVALVAASHEAELVVVGARGLGRFASRILGSVSQKVAAQAACPVTVVRGDATAPEGPVAVGVDPVDVVPEVVEFGVRTAQRRGIAVRLLVVFDPVPAEVEVPQVVRQLAAAAEEREQEMQHLAAEWQDRYPDVPIELAVRHADPVDVLAGAVDEASMVVVGSRGRRGLTGRRLGSVAQGVLHVAPLATVLPVHA